VDQGDAVAAWLAAFLGVADLRLVHFNEVSVWADCGVRVEKESQQHARNIVVGGGGGGDTHRWVGLQSVCNLTVRKPQSRYGTNRLLTTSMIAHLSQCKLM
jgi:hypothetical protein